MLVLRLFCVAGLGYRMTGAMGDVLASTPQLEAGAQEDQEPASPSMPSRDTRVQVFEARTGQWMAKLLQDVGGDTAFLWALFSFAASAGTACFLG